MFGNNKMSIQSIVLLFVIALNSVLAYAASTTTKYLYVLVPDDKEWLYDDMMASTDGGVTGTKMEVAPGMCGWYRMAWEEAPEEVLIYLQNHPDQIVGQYGLWGNEAVPTPLPLKTILEAYGSDQLYFIPDDAQWDEGTEDQMGLFVSDPGVNGVCSFELAAVIYDTDESLWTSQIGHIFSTDEDDAGYAGQCLGVRTGIVQTDLGADGKPQLDTTAGGNGINCFGSADNFNKLFNYVQGLNEVQCYDMPFRRYGTDPRWAFDSDSATMAGNLGGFYPVDNTSDATVETSISPVACPTCRTKRFAQGPVPFNMDADAFDRYCNGPGWAGGIDCGAIASGNLTYFGNGDNPGVWDWGAARWEGQHNQQFCFESHAKFTYQEDQEFTFRGDDDIWVFINKKLAVDNGGTHFPAPGYVQLKQLNNTYGAGFLVPGSEYSLDIFFCDRRTTMSNVIIKTNMFIKQTSGLSTTSTNNSDGSVNYNLCYDKSGDGSCASVALGQSGQSKDAVHACGKDIEKYGSLKYRITTRAGEEKATLTAGASGLQYGGFDLSDQFNPKIYPEKINKLSPGSYRLVIEFCNKNGECEEKSKTYINFRIKGRLDVMTQNSTYVVYAGDEKSPFYASGTKWTFVDKGLAGSRVPIYVSAFADGEVDLLGAIGQTYTLSLAAGMTAYTSKIGDTQVTWPRAVGLSGIDTIWVSQGLDGLTTTPEEKVVTLKSRAKIKFYAPELHFAEPLTVDESGHVTSWKHPLGGDPDFLDGDLYFHWVGSDVDLYVLVINPITGQICNDCQVPPSLVEASPSVSMSVNPVASEGGVYMVSVRSSREYMDESAYITISAPEDVNGVNWSSYVNMRFRQTPAPYPQLVDLFDTRGKPMGPLNIPEPYYSESKDYLDGRADSVVIYYSRPFRPNSQGSYADSLPHLICLDWDEENSERLNLYRNGVSMSRADTAVQCSYTIDSASIYRSFMARYRANGNKSDSILSFAVTDTAFSKQVKTSGKGKLLSYAKYVDKGKLVKWHFDRIVTDRIAPVIVSTSIVNFSDRLNRLTVTLSEPVKLLDETNKIAPFTFYMNSATELSEAKRYASPTAVAAPTGIGTDKIVLVFDKTQPAQNPTPRLGDYVRFRADSWMWSDTADIAADGVERVADDYYWHWNSPTDYNSSPRLPSPWVRVKLDDSYSSSSQGKLSSSSKNAEGGECTLTDKGDGRIIQKCGDQKTVLYKALCGNEPYDPDGDYFCYGVKLYEKCDDEVYDVNSQECVDDEVVKKGSKSSGKNKSQAIKTVTQVSWLVQTSGRTIHIQGVKVGSAYALIDMQGRVLNRGVVSNKNFAIPVGLGGQYMLKIGNQTQVVRVW